MSGRCSISDIGDTQARNQEQGEDREQSKDKMYLYLASFGHTGTLPAPNATMHGREGCIRKRSEDNDRLISTAPTFELIESRATRRHRLSANVEGSIVRPRIDRVELPDAAGKHASM